MRSIDKKYSFWLAGYYDDFNSARAVPDDSNTLGTTYKSSETHHGSPMSGYADLNPRYTYAWVERGDANGGRFNNASVTAASSNGEQYLHNQGMDKWLKFDGNRREDSSYWLNRAQFHYPNSIANANRQKYDGGTGVTGNAYKSSDTVEGYILVSNGYDSSGKYMIQTGDSDSTFGRTAMTAYNDSSNRSRNGTQAAAHSSGVPTVNLMQYSHLTGLVVGEQNLHGTATQYSNRYLFPLKSPAGKPFLHIRQWKKNTAAATYSTAIVYDGSLNSLGDYDVFTMRFNMQSWQASDTVVNGTGFNDAEFDLKFELGFTSAAAETGYSTTPAITYTIDSSSVAGSALTDWFLQWNSSTENTYTDTQLWYDIDFIIDYTNQNFDVFWNGARITSSAVSFGSKPGGGNWTAADMYGWQTSIRCGETVTGHWLGLLSIDRVGLVKPLNEELSTASGLSPRADTDYYRTQIESFVLNKGVNAVSNAKLQLTDDTNTMISTLTPLISGSSYASWELLVFRDAIDRPLWRGSIDRFSINQDKKTKALEATITANDCITLLDQELPNWEVGQGGDANDGETISFRRADVQSKLDTYYFGVNKLEARNATLGYNYVQDNAYLPHVDSRMSLNSAHPIQMYINEDENGPNNLEDGYNVQEIGPAYIPTSSSDKIRIKDTYFITNGFDISQGLFDEVKIYGKSELPALVDDPVITAGTYALSNGGTDSNWTSITEGPTADGRWFEVDFADHASALSTLNKKNLITGAGSYGAKTYTTTSLDTVTSSGITQIHSYNQLKTNNVSRNTVYEISLRASGSASNVGANYRVGDLVTISGDNRSVSINGTYRVISSNSIKVVLDSNVPHGQTFTATSTQISFKGSDTVIMSPSTSTSNFSLRVTPSTAKYMPSVVASPKIVNVTNSASSTSATIRYTGKNTLFKKIVNRYNFWTRQFVTSTSYQDYPSFQGQLPHSVTLTGCTFVTGTTINSGDTLTYGTNQSFVKVATSNLASNTEAGHFIGLSAYATDSGASTTVNLSGIYEIQSTEVDGANTKIYFNFPHDASVDRISTSTGDGVITQAGGGVRVINTLENGGEFFSAKGEISYAVNTKHGDPSHKVLHSKWIRDIASSRWFRHKFTRISQDALKETTLISDITPSSSSMYVSDISPVYSEIQQGMISFEFQNPYDAGFVDKVSTGTYATQTAVSNQFYIVPPPWTNGGNMSQAGYTYQNGGVRRATVRVRLPGTDWQAGDIVAITNSETISLNGVWYIDTLVKQGSNYMVTLYLNKERTQPLLWPITSLQNISVGRINGASVTIQVSSELPFSSQNLQPDKLIYPIKTGLATGLTTSSTSVVCDDASSFPTSGYGVLKQSNPMTGQTNIDYFQYTGKSSNTLTGVTGISRTHIAALTTVTVAPKMELGNTDYASSKNFLSRSHSEGETLRLRKFTDNNASGYKHIYVLWADMRNDGNADADGGERKNDFGLLYPSAKNYSLKFVWASQDTDSFEERPAFTEIKLGEEANIWSLDAEAEIGSGSSWSLIGGSDSEPNPLLQNWEDKAGAFVIIDLSPFFNLNTDSNGGRIGQLSGGRKELGDFVVETEGFPVLVDNYWAEAPATFKNTPFNSAITQHPNQFNFISDASLVALDIGGDVGRTWNSTFLETSHPTVAPISGITDNYIVIQDATNWPSSGHGQLVSASEGIYYFYKWTSKGYSATIATIATTGSANSIGSFSCAVTVGGGNLMQPGQTITISNSNSTPSIDGEYVIQRAFGGTTYTIELPFEVTGAGNAGTAANDNALRVDNGAVIYEGSFESGNGLWNGLSYDTSNFPDGRGKSAYTLLEDANTGCQIDVAVTGDEDEDENFFEDLTAYNTLSSVFPMRLMMQLDGYVESRNSGTWFENDKLRVPFMDGLTETWTKQTVLPTMFDINNVPIMKNHSVIQKTFTTATYTQAISNSSFSSSKTTLTVGTSANFSVGDKITVIGTTAIDGTYTVEAIPAATTVRFVGGTSGTYTSGYVYKTSLFDNWGSVMDGRNQNLSGIISGAASASATGSDYGSANSMFYLVGRDGRIEFRPTYTSGFTFNRSNLKISNLSGDATGQTSNVRVIYSGGASFVDYPSATLGTKARWKIIQQPDIYSSVEALAIAKEEYNKNQRSPLTLTAEILRPSSTDTFAFDGDVMTNGARYGYIADPSRCGLNPRHGYSWSSITGGVPFPGMTNALDGSIGDAVASATTGTLAWNDAYYFYGANSVSHAIQIVSLPRNFPTISEESPGSDEVSQLRVIINLNSTVAAGTSPDNAVFDIHLVDAVYTDRTFYSTVSSATNISVKGSGIYEMDIPSSYWSDGSGKKILVSVNYEYLQALLKNKCGSTTGANIHRDAHEVTDVTGASSYNTSSIFPLGARIYSEMATEFANQRSLWYAPRIHVTDDFTFQPATTVTYTDAYLGLSNEPMTIKSMNYTVKAGQTESLNMTLQRDASRAARTFSSWFVPENSRTGNRAGVPSDNRGNGMSGLGFGRGPSDSNDSNNRSSDGINSSRGSRDVPANTPTTSELSPRDSPRPSGPDSPGAATNRSDAVSANTMTNTTVNRMKGTMDIGSDGIVGGNFSVPGQNKSGSVPKNIVPLSVTNLSPSSGFAATTTDGFTLPGVVITESGYEQYPLQEITMTVKVPTDVVSSFVTVSGNITLDTGSSSGQRGLITTEVYCIEAGVPSPSNRIFNTKTINSSSSAPVVSQTTTLFAGKVPGANIPGNTLVVKFTRTPNDGTDSALYSSINVSNPSVGVNKRAVTGQSKSPEFTYKKSRNNNAG